jgi:hypothetical protein
MLPSSMLLVTSYVLYSFLSLSTLMVEAIRSSETPFLQDPHGVTSQKTAFFTFTAVKASNHTWHIPWALSRRSNVFPVRYELGFCIPEDGILHSRRRENLESYNMDLL